MTHDHLFSFEDDFVASLRCIPMAVRLKLDRIAIKLTLRQWSRFTGADRRDLLTSPCATADEVSAYRDRVVELVEVRAREPARPLADPPRPLWEDAAHLPAAVSAFAERAGLAPPRPDEWRALNELQRFVLLKLSRDNHDNVNFVPAMREFGLARAR